MTSKSKQLDEHIGTRISGKLKRTYREHAMKKHGLRLGDWIRMHALCLRLRRAREAAALAQEPGNSHEFGVMMPGQETLTGSTPRL